MKNGVFKFYLLIVCFVALMCAAITLGKGLYNVVSLVAPKLTLNTYIYNKHKSIETFRQSMTVPNTHNPRALYAVGSPGMPMPRIMPFEGIHSGVPVDNDKTVDQTTMSDDEVNELRLKSLNSTLSNHRREALQNVIQLGIIFFIALSLFVVHWRIANKTDDQAHSTPQ